MNEELGRAVSIGQSNALSRAILRHPYLKCLEPRIRAIHAAIDSGMLAACREDGRKVDEHVAYERRHVHGLALKEWAKEIAPSERPAFLFDELERDTHAGISAEAYRTLQASHEAKTHQLAEANERLREASERIALIEAERNSLRAMVDNFDAHPTASGEPSARAETTFLNIIGALLALLLGKSPAGKPHSSFASQAAVISALLAHHEGKPGISARTLEEKFAAAKRSVNAS
ncbi:protein kinase [Burkholderia seminalis]|uniref:protein kinase n=1 Tax=Burkholderia seminalis TaxID=488731 RepID=UPI001583D4C1|nr:protein kinase [Burkholderia seminalis]MCA8431885.1 ATP-binding protein [Burkholderia seminalis]